MRKLFYIMGKSASGKDTLYRMLLSDSSLALCPFVIYTTRPMRDGEQEGVQYHFTDEKGLHRLKETGKVIEQRTYDTVKGPWHYFTVDDGSMEAQDKGDLLGIGTPESYCRIRDHFGADRVIPLYVAVSEDILRERALKREMEQAVPQIKEMERRLKADRIDFSPEKLKEAGITQTYDNSGKIQDTIGQLRKAIERSRGGMTGKE